MSGAHARFVVLFLSGACIFGCSSEKEPPHGSPGSVPKTAAGDPKAAARTVVEEAILAHGGKSYNEPSAGRFRVFTRGQVSPTARDEIVSETLFQFPDRLRESISATTIVGESRQTLKWSYLRDGKQAWDDEGNGVLKSTTDLRPIEDAFPLNLIRDLHAMRDGRFAIDLVRGETGIRLLATNLTNEGPPPFEVTFDPVTKRISGISTVDYNPNTRRVGRSETQFSKYVNFAGTWLPTVAVSYLDGQLFVEKSLVEFTPLDRVDPAEFKPK